MPSLNRLVPSGEKLPSEATTAVGYPGSAGRFTLNEENDEEDEDKDEENGEEEEKEKEEEEDDDDEPSSLSSTIPQVPTGFLKGSSLTGAEEKAVTGAAAAAAAGVESEGGGGAGPMKPLEGRGRVPSGTGGG